MAPKTNGQAVVRVTRTIPASPDRVYRAWLEPDLLRQWLTPGLEVTRVEIDERVGGHYRIWQGDDTGDKGGFECELLELVPSERIVFRWGWVGPDRLDGPCFDSKLTVTLDEERDGETELTLVHERLETLWEAMPFVAESVGPGWEMCVDNLVSVLKDQA